MDIQLKQKEITEALKQFIVSQGISLTGKSVSISFTAGRKESGITADISIEDSAHIVVANPVKEHFATTVAKSTIPKITQNVEAPLHFEPVEEPVLLEGLTVEGLTVGSTSLFSNK